MARGRLETNAPHVVAAAYDRWTALTWAATSTYEGRIEGEALAVDGGLGFWEEAARSLSCKAERRARTTKLPSDVSSAESPEGPMEMQLVSPSSGLCLLIS